jgi:hypothetical protein
VILATNFEKNIDEAFRNATLNAGFYAASHDQQITMHAVVIGLAREYRKMGRLITAKDFGVYHDLLDQP